MPIAKGSHYPALSRAQLALWENHRRAIAALLLTQPHLPGIEVLRRLGIHSDGVLVKRIRGQLVAAQQIHAYQHNGGRGPRFGRHHPPGCWCLTLTRYQLASEFCAQPIPIQAFYEAQAQAALPGEKQRRILFAATGLWAGLGLIDAPAPN